MYILIYCHSEVSNNISEIVASIISSCLKTDGITRNYSITLSKEYKKKLNLNSYGIDEVW